jgi:hypothetical protein
LTGPRILRAFRCDSGGAIPVRTVGHNVCGGDLQ